MYCGLAYAVTLRLRNHNCRELVLKIGDTHMVHKILWGYGCVWLLGL